MYTLIGKVKQKISDKIDYYAVLMRNIILQFRTDILDNIINLRDGRGKIYI